jgi:hypothetical protein
VIRSLISRMQMYSPLPVIREKWIDFKLATINPMAPHLHELVVARANLTRPMQPRRTR